MSNEDIFMAQVNQYFPCTPLYIYIIPSIPSVHFSNTFFYTHKDIFMIYLYEFTIYFYALKVYKSLNTVHVTYGNTFVYSLTEYLLNINVLIFKPPNSALAMACFLYHSTNNTNC